VKESWFFNSNNTSSALICAIITLVLAQVLGKLQLVWKSWPFYQELYLSSIIFSITASAPAPKQGQNS
jgi:hypothetical protein